eukprot:774027_1
MSAMVSSEAGVMIVDMSRSARRFSSFFTSSATMPRRLDGEAVEDYCIIYSVEEFGFEVLLHGIVNPLLHQLLIAPLQINDILTSNIRSENDDAVLEVHHVSL